MKEKELRQHAKCNICGKGIMASGLPLFWRVTVERFGLDADALREQQGLGMMMGGQLAMVMGADRDMATPMMDAAVITVCESCCTKNTCVAQLAESV